ncbi:MAG: glutamate--tRNA ligase [Nanoarchaeota archaeon]|nr:glutamate--tRNA ligase [Nanoarchaeota archaeon]
MKDLDKKIRAYTLKNAIAYKGKANSGAVVSALFNEGLDKKDVRVVMPKIQEAIKEIEKLSLDKQEKEFEKLKKMVSEREVREGLPELPGAKKGKVIMRFAPSPSGAMHIGHAMTGSISYLFVKKYGGEFYVRIEDTNPENIYEPAYKLLEEDSKWLFEGNAKIMIQSKRMARYYKYAETLIKKKSAYVCTCSGDEFRKFSKNKKECPCRALNVKENIGRWEKMKDKKGYKEGEVVLRFKSSMSHPNPAMRDFPLARVNTTSHPLQKKKYRVWPLMNLSVTVDDIDAGMTHIIRAKEHRDNAKRQEMMYKILGKKFPWTGFLGRIKFKDMELSATKITQGIKEGKYKGWDDPRLPTLATLRNKGYKPQAFWRFAENVGLSENDKVMDKKEFFTLLDNFNKDKKL